MRKAGPVNLRGAMSPFSPVSSGRSFIDHLQVKSTCKQLDQIAPKFYLDPAKIEVLYTPKQFYSTLTDMISKAKRRVFLSTLYIGRTEHSLVDTLRKALNSNDKLTVEILSDALRGTRESPRKPSSATLLATLVKEFGPDRVKVSMYHTPQLHGLTKWLVPHRFNEGFGLQHMKIYGADDSIILSGANLSNDYFTDRQDRYILFKNCTKFADYYHRIQQAVASISYRLIPSKDVKSGFFLDWPHYQHEPTKHPKEFVEHASQLLSPLLIPANDSTEASDTSDSNTFAYAVSQFTPLLTSESSTEYKAILRILTMLGSDRFSWMLSAGYFNVLPEFSKKLFKTNPTDAVALTASPEANGFYKSAGVSSLLPGAYSHIAHQFLLSLKKAGLNQAKMMEWKKGVVNTPQGWSFHAKGLWVALPPSKGQTTAPSPFLTIIGSSNYTRRGYTHDLETNAILFTQDPSLQAQLHKEVDNLLKNAVEMTPEDYETPERRPDWRQRTFVKYMGDRL